MLSAGLRYYVGDLGCSVIQPTGKAFDVLYSTTGKWRGGRLIEEYLFYDNGTFLLQVGLA